MYLTGKAITKAYVPTMEENFAEQHFVCLQNCFGKHEVQPENLNPFSILKLFAQTWNMTARQLINKHCQRHY